MAERLDHQHDALPPGAPRLDRYRLRRPAASGSTAEVYLAEDTLLASDMSEALVAVKVSSGVSEDALPSFLEEARRARAVEHSNVVRVLDAGSAADGRAFVVQEWIEGRTLDAALVDERTKWSERRVVELIAGVGDGLEAVHAAGLVHCDLKPSNVLLDGSGRPRIVDFGAASRRRAGDEDLGGGLRGTPAFIAPERLASPKARPTPSSDVYALGALAVWALLAWSDSREAAGSALITLQSSAEAHVRARGATLRDAASDGDLRAILARATHGDPARRYPSAGAFAADLRRWLGREPIAWTEPGLRRRLGLLARRKPVTLALGVTLVLALGAALVASESARRNAARSAADRQAAAAGELELKIEQARREADNIWQQRMGETLRMFMASTGAKFADKGLDAEVLTSLWILEWILGPQLLDSPEMLSLVWDQRIKTLDERLGRWADSGQGDSIGANLVRVSLGLWLVLAREPDRAIEMLDRARVFWAERSEPTDVWLERIDDLHLAARLERAIASGVEDEIAPLLREARSRVEALARDNERGPVREALRTVIQRANAVVAAR